MLVTYESPVRLLVLPDSIFTVTLLKFPLPLPSSIFPLKVEQSLRLRVILDALLDFVEDAELTIMFPSRVSLEAFKTALLEFPVQPSFTTDRRMFPLSSLKPDIVTYMTTINYKGGVDIWFSDFIHDKIAMVRGLVQC